MHIQFQLAQQCIQISTRVNSSSVHTYIFVCFTLHVILQGFVTQNATETTLQTDVSKKGFGAVVLQEEQPIYYASRALTSAEKNSRILNVRLRQHFGAWRNSTIFSMVESPFYRLTRNL